MTAVLNNLPGYPDSSYALPALQIAYQKLSGGDVDNAHLAQAIYTLEGIALSYALPVPALKAMAGGQMAGQAECKALIDQLQSNGVGAVPGFDFAKLLALIKLIKELMGW